MIRGLSFIIACILTVLLAMILYPIAAIFWFIGIVGDVVGVISKWIFTHANRMIQYLWADLRNGGNPDTTFDNRVDANNDTTQN